MALTRAERDRRDALLVQGLRICPTCPEGPEIRPVSDFNRYRRSRDGYAVSCRRCAENARLRSVAKHGRKRGRPVSRSCVVAGCERAAITHAGELDICATHYARKRRRGSVHIVLPRHPSGENSYKWKGDNVSYNTAHKRNQYLRGKASEYQCVDCGSQAQEWAYQYTAGDREMTEWIEDTRVGRARELAYSPDAEHYAAMCKSCHIKFDKRERVSA